MWLAGWCLALGVFWWWVDVIHHFLAFGLSFWFAGWVGYGGFS